MAAPSVQSFCCLRSAVLERVVLRACCATPAAESHAGRSMSSVSGRATRRDRRPLVCRRNRKNNVNVVDVSVLCVPRSFGAFTSRSLGPVRLLATAAPRDRNSLDSTGRKDKVLTVPNFLSLLRIALSPCLGYLVVHEAYVPCAALFGLAFFTDWLDGWIARNWSGQRSMLGTVLDPLGDKILVGTLTVSLTAVHIIPVGLTALILLRDVGLIACSTYIKFKSLSQPRTLRKLIDFGNNRTVEFQPSLLSKWNTAIQMSLITSSLLAPIFGFVDHAFLHYLWYLTGTTTVLSALGYVFQGGNRKIN